MQKNPESEAAFSMTQSSAKGLRRLILENPDTLKKIFGKKNKDSELRIKHSLNVCALSVKLASALRHKNDDLDDLGTAALIHDL
jgi:HD superfamily phosphodiesterase